MFLHCSSLVVVGSVLYTTSFLCQVAVTIFTIYTFIAYCTVFSCNEVICSSKFRVFFSYSEKKCSKSTSINSFFFKLYLYMLNVFSGLFFILIYCSVE